MDKILYANEFKKYSRYDQLLDAIAEPDSINPLLVDKRRQTYGYPSVEHVDCVCPEGVEAAPLRGLPRRRERKKERATPDDAETDKTTNDNAVPDSVTLCPRPQSVCF